MLPDPFQRRAHRMGRSRICHGEEAPAHSEENFPEVLIGKKVVCLHTPDLYRYLQPELVDELKASLSPHIELPD